MTSSESRMQHIWELRKANPQWTSWALAKALPGTNLARSLRATHTHGVLTKAEFPLPDAFAEAEVLATMIN